MFGPLRALTPTASGEGGADGRLCGCRAVSVQEKDLHQTFPAARLTSRLPDSREGDTQRTNVCELLSGCVQSARVKLTAENEMSAR